MDRQIQGNAGFRQAAPGLNPRKTDRKERPMDIFTGRDHVVPEDRARLITLESNDRAVQADWVLDGLRRDFVILVRKVPPARVDGILRNVAAGLGLLEHLELQAAYAEFFGHRQRVGQYRMTVNKRADYQFIPPHSEGDSFTNMQLAAFYCIENSTDGGETILMNVDDSSEIWLELREKLVRIAPGSRSLTPGELKRAARLYHLDSTASGHPDDLILGTRQTDISGFALLDVLAHMRKTNSAILGKDVYAYWQSAAIIDFDSLPPFVSLLEHCELLRRPAEGIELRHIDNAARQRIWSSGMTYDRLFTCRVTHKLIPGDLVLQNNLTWTHAVSNWTPGRGVRNVAAAFA
jgi:hypothetical protein